MIPIKLLVSGSGPEKLLKVRSISSTCIANGKEGSGPLQTYKHKSRRPGKSTWKQIKQTQFVARGFPIKTIWKTDLVNAWSTFRKRLGKPHVHRKTCIQVQVYVWYFFKRKWSTYDREQRLQRMNVGLEALLPGTIAMLASLNHSSGMFPCIMLKKETMLKDTIY